MAKVTVDDLRRIKEKTAGEMALRQTNQEIRVIVHIGDCGLKAGARDIMKTFINELAQAGRHDILLLAADCPDPENCRNEPKVTVETGDGKPVVYQDVTQEKAREIFSKHVINGTVVTEYILQ